MFSFINNSTSLTARLTPGQKPEAFDKTDICVGIDLGVKEFAITSDDLHIANPKYLRSLEDKLIKLQRELSRKKLHSNNYEKLEEIILDNLHRICLKYLDKNKVKKSVLNNYSEC